MKLSTTKARNVLSVNKCLFPCSGNLLCSGRLQSKMAVNYWNQWELRTQIMWIFLMLSEYKLAWTLGFFFHQNGSYKYSYCKWSLQFLHYCAAKLLTDRISLWCVKQHVMLHYIFLTWRKLIWRLCVTSHYGFMWQNTTFQISLNKLKGRTVTKQLLQICLLFTSTTIIKKVFLKSKFPMITSF